MVVLNVTYKCKPGMRESFYEKIVSEGIDVKCRAEDGNIKYDYYMSCLYPDEMVLLEKWRDPDALAVHAGQAHFARLGELKAEFTEDTIIEKFFVE